MKEITFQGLEFVEEAIKVFTSDLPVFAFEFSGVYGLMALNSIQGALALDRVKSRLPGKYYGSFLGDFNSFFQVTHPCKVEDCKKMISLFEGSFLRVPVYCKKNETYVIHEGQHQFLIETESTREVIFKLEIELKKRFPNSDFFVSNYQSPLCTSANESGDLSGGIQDREEALEFAFKKKIALFVHTGLHQKDSGSYPVFTMLNNQIQIVRNGPHDEEISRKVNEYLSN